MQRHKQTKVVPSLPVEAVRWNKVCNTLSKVLHCSSGRMAHLRARRDDSFWVLNFEQALIKIMASEFCQGVNERKWQATFDWLVGRPDALAKVMEGKYDNKHGNENERRDHVGAW
jgi:hypothetical protein